MFVCVCTCVYVRFVFENAYVCFNFQVYFHVFVSVSSLCVSVSSLFSCVCVCLVCVCVFKVCFHVFVCV